MDVYRALNADVPQTLFTVLHQASTTVLEDEFTRTVTAFDLDIGKQMHEMSERLHLWLMRQYNQQAIETLQKLQRLGVLSQSADVGEVHKILEKDYSRLGNRIGSENLLGMEGFAEEIFIEGEFSDPDLAKRVADGREYGASLGFKLGQGPIHATWLLFRGSIHYDIMEHIARDRVGIYIGSHGAHIGNVGLTSFDTYNLVYQLGEALTAHLDTNVMTQEVTLAFSKDPNDNSNFRNDVSALMEYVAEHINVIHASFWQRKLGLGTGIECMMRLRLAIGEEPVQEVIRVFEIAGRIGRETIIKHGELILSKRTL